MRAMYAFVLQQNCVAQDPKYEDSPLGRMTTRARSFPGWTAWRQQPYERCLALKHPITTGLCDDLMNLPFGESRQKYVDAVNAVLDRHADDVKAADRALRLLVGKLDGASEQFVCPSSLPDSAQDQR